MWVNLCAFEDGVHDNRELFWFEGGVRFCLSASGYASQNAYQKGLTMLVSENECYQVYNSMLQASASSSRFQQSKRCS